MGTRQAGRRRRDPADPRPRRRSTCTRPSPQLTNTVDAINTSRTLPRRSTRCRPTSAARPRRCSRCSRGLSRLSTTIASRDQELRHAARRRADQVTATLRPARSAAQQLFGDGDQLLDELNSAATRSTRCWSTPRRCRCSCRAWSADNQKTIGPLLDQRRTRCSSILQSQPGQPRPRPAAARRRSTGCSTTRSATGAGSTTTSRTSIPLRPGAHPAARGDWLMAEAARAAPDPQRHRCWSCWPSWAGGRLRLPRRPGQEGLGRLRLRRRHLPGHAGRDPGHPGRQGDQGRAEGRPPSTSSSSTTTSTSCRPNVGVVDRRQQPGQRPVPAADARLHAAGAVLADGADHPDEPHVVARPSSTTSTPR